MLGGEISALGSQTQRLRAQFHEPGGMRQIHPAFLTTAIGIVARYRVVAAQSGNALARPTIAATCQNRITVEHARNDIICTDSDQGADCIDDFGWGLRGSLTTPPSGQSQFGMNATLPMNIEDDLADLRINIYDDLVKQGTHDAFLESRIGLWVVPHRFQICGKVFEVGAVKLPDTELRPLLLLDSEFDFPEAL